MAKTIYTERDVEDLARRGAKEILMTDDVYLTDSARERAEKLGVALVRSEPRREAEGRAPGADSSSTSLAPLQTDAEQIVSQVKTDVLSKLGPGVDAALIERIVRRVIGQLK